MAGSKSCCFSLTTIVNIAAWVQITESLLSFVISASNADFDLLKPEFAKGDTLARLLNLEQKGLLFVDVFQAACFFILLVLSIYLLLWSHEGNARGLMIWLVVTAISDIVGLPMTVYLMYANNFKLMEIFMNIGLYLVEVVSLWAVWKLIRHIKMDKPPVKA